MNNNLDANMRHISSALEKPRVYDPIAPLCKGISVKPVEFKDEEEKQKERSLISMLILGAIFGFIGGVLLISLDASKSKLTYDLLSGYTEGQITAHCLIWGAVIGALMGLILYPIYKNLDNALPVYSLLLFLPVILFFACNPLVALNALLYKIGKFIVTAVIVIVVIIILYSFFS